MAERKQRSDALQNRARVLAAAQVAVAKFGAHASLDKIAKQAGVGPGTLYRHFPTRVDLWKAVYQAAAQALAAAAAELADTLPPTEALRSWLLLFVEYLADKQIIAPALSALVDDPCTVDADSYVQIREAVRGLVERAIQAGELRADVDAIDLLWALAGISSVPVGADWQSSAKKLVDTLIRGSRPEP